MIYTIGHSTRPIEEFLNLLAVPSVEQIIDVRTIPKSRRNPQYSQESLAETIKRASMLYQHLPGLGGLRHPHRDSINTAWKNDSFRGYADYMQTPAFQENLAKLVELSNERASAIMCAEAVPWRCHRSLIADALLARGLEVGHILGKHSLKRHAYTPFAQVEGFRVTYPGLPVAVRKPG